MKLQDIKEGMRLEYKCPICARIDIAEICPDTGTYTILSIKQYYGELLCSNSQGSLEIDYLDPGIIRWFSPPSCKEFSL